MDGKTEVFGYIRVGVNRIAASPWLYFCLIFLLSFTVSYKELDQTPRQYLVPDDYREQRAIAISLVKTGQFADPYLIPTGPTAHLPPIYPYIYYFFYNWFGLTPKAGQATWLIAIVMGSILYGLLPWLAGKLGAGVPAGVLGGIAGAVLIKLPSHGEYLAAIFMSLILIAFLRSWEQRKTTWVGSLFLGLGSGVAFHVQPALLPVILGSLLFGLWWSKDARKWLYCGVMLLGMIIACLPWGWRNYTTFGKLIFIRNNFGLELRLGNHEGATAMMELMIDNAKHLHPRASHPEARLMAEIGEAEYMHLALVEAVEWIRSNPLDFLQLTMQRAVNLWAGPLHRPRDALGVFVLSLLALFGLVRLWGKLTSPQRAAFLIPLITYPLIYYIVAYMPRYRQPIDWILYILAGAAVWGLIERDLIVRT